MGELNANFQVLKSTLRVLTLGGVQAEYGNQAQTDGIVELQLNLL